MLKRSQPGSSYHSETEPKLVTGEREGDVAQQKTETKELSNQIDRAQGQDCHLRELQSRASRDG